VKDLTERRLSGEQVFDGKLLKVHRDEVLLPDGSRGVREYIRHPGAVAIVPLFDDRRVLLERQFRYPFNREFLEIPAGKIDPSETPLDTGKRELLEETGYTAGEWTRIGVIHTAIAYIDEGIEMFLARKLAWQGRQLDAGEFLETQLVEFQEAIRMIRDGRITDAKTVAALPLLEHTRQAGGPR
jgi:ADP-ribose pyrophosphatase